MSDVTLPSTSLGLERLKRLSAHMLGGDRYHDKFCFKVYALPLDPAEPACGTMGCAAGELPGLFPEEWEFVERTRGNEVALRDVAQASATVEVRHISTGEVGLDGLQEFFAILRLVALHLFYPNAQRDRYRHAPLVSPLGGGASLDAVVENIDSYIVTRDPDYLDTYNERWGTAEVDNV